MTERSDPLAAAHRLLVDSLARLINGDDWRRYLDFAARFHSYSPLNVVLLMAQGAQGPVAGYQRWRTIAAVDGRPCQVAKGATGQRILAPLVRRRAVDSSEGDQPVVIKALVGFKTVVVFDQTQLVSPPAVAEPPRPVLLQGSGPVGFAHGVSDAIARRGYRLGFDPMIEPANGRTDFAQRTVSLRPGLSPAQICKTLAHEWAHTALHTPDSPDPACPDRSRRSKQNLWPGCSPTTPGSTAATTASLSPDSRVLTRPWPSAGFHRSRTPSHRLTLLPG